MPLDEAVRGVAACPCYRHQDSFVAALGETDELVLRLTGPTAPIDDGEILTVGTATNEGRSFLHAFTDMDAARATFPEASFKAVKAQVAFRMALSGGNEGLLVTAGGGEDAWAAVTADGVVRLIDEPPGRES
jgi:hypothetical protein